MKTTITPDHIAILKKFNKKKSGDFVQGSARDLADMFGLETLVPHRAPRFKPPPYLLNWGNTGYSSWIEQYTVCKENKIINHPMAVAKAVDKKKALEVMRYKSIPCLIFTTYRSDAVRWLEEGSRVYCRTLNRATQGRGIVIADSPSEIVPAPLYTVEYEKNREYRVHVFNGKVIDVQIKKKRSPEHLEELGVTANPDVRNMGNGYVFCRGNIRRNEAMEKACIDAIRALQLDFGAVDVLGKVDNETNELVDFALCEVNTAPALTGTTLDVYIAALSDLLDDRVQITNEFIKSVENAL